MKHPRKTVAPPASAPAYPRPQLQREAWLSLDGPWDFAFDPAGEWQTPEAVVFDRTIRVPFAPETPLSGIDDRGFYNVVWYRRTFAHPKLAADQCLLLHFGAVDYTATVWVNGQPAVTHEGGYTPFFVDITHFLTGSGEQTIVVRAEDDPLDLAKPRGKQDWQEQAHSIWYWRTTGIWQSVWMETVRKTHIASICWMPNMARWELGLDVHIADFVRDHLFLTVRLEAGGRQLAHDTYHLTTQELHRQIAFADPGIDDYRNELLWSPSNPTLIQATLELRDRVGNLLDQVQSYTAMRSISLLGNRFVLNGKPVQLQLVLDQGYWQDGGLTAPDDEALRRDVELVKAMGFNGVRKHQKIENPRFLYWADRLGLFVWEEMPSTYRFSPESVRRLTTQWAEAIQRDRSHPCIIAWVPFNESWGVPDLPDSPSQVHCVQALYHLTKTLDPTRPVIGNDGWEAAATDIVAIHDYDPDPGRIATRYGGGEASVEQMLRNERPGHKLLMLEGFQYSGQPLMLTEFGGIAFSKDLAHTWGYSRARTAQQFADQYARLLHAVRPLPLLAGFCYTQFTDTYQEANGLLYMDRTPKFPLEEIAVATRGPRSEQEWVLQAQWQKRLLAPQEGGGKGRV
jgi:beta-galactosidase/beta-glucuronidase